MDLRHLIPQKLESCTNNGLQTVSFPMEKSFVVIVVVQQNRHLSEKGKTNDFLFVCI